MVSLDFMEDLFLSMLLALVSGYGDVCKACVFAFSGCGRSCVRCRIYALLCLSILPSAPTKCFRSQRLRNLNLSHSTRCCQDYERSAAWYSGPNRELLSDIWECLKWASLLDPVVAASIAERAR